MRKFFLGMIFSLMMFSFAVPVFAQEAVTDEAAELAKKLSNPVASLISVPFQYNYDSPYGTDKKGSKNVLNIQPVIPFSLGDDWNLITRTIIPLVDYNGMPSLSPDEGMGDILQSFFFSPKAPVGGWIVGFGPVIQYPSATDAGLGSEKWSAGPTALALQQKKGWTYGLLTNHVSSFAGEEDRSDVNATFVQPFLSYTTKKRTTYGLNTESTYNWVTEEWSTPINLSVAQLLKIGKMPVQLTFGVRHWVDSPDNRPEGIGYRFGITLLFPTAKK
jgi:hypothetical protein